VGGEAQRPPRGQPGRLGRLSRFSIDQCRVLREDEVLSLHIATSHHTSRANNLFFVFRFANWFTSGTTTFFSHAFHFY